MTLTSRRQFVRQMALAAAPLYGQPSKAIAAAVRIFESWEQTVA